MWLGHCRWLEGKKGGEAGATFEAAPGTEIRAATSSHTNCQSPAVPSRIPSEGRGDCSSQGRPWLAHTNMRSLEGVLSNEKMHKPSVNQNLSNRSGAAMKGASHQPGHCWVFFPSRDPKPGGRGSRQVCSHQGKFNLCCPGLFNAHPRTPRLGRGRILSSRELIPALKWDT